MKTFYTRFCFIITGLILVVPGSQSLSAGNNDPELRALIIKNLPAKDAGEAVQINRALFNMGEAAIRDICKMLDVPDSADVVTAQYALSSLTDYAAQNPNKEERKTLLKAIHQSLNSESTFKTKLFLLRQLVLIGGDESVETIGHCLTEKPLVDPALKALTAINSEKAQKEVLQALELDGADKSKIVKALGDMRAEMPAETIQNLLSTGNTNLDFTCAEALARIGDPAGFRLALDKIPQSEKNALYLIYFRRRIELGDMQPAVDFCRKILSESRDRILTISALYLLENAADKNAIQDLLKAADSPDIQVYCAALKLLQKYQNDQVVTELMTKIDSVSTTKKIKIIEFLAGSKNKSVLTCFEELAESSNEMVRIAALRALVASDPDKALGALMSVLGDSLSPVEKKAVKEMLLLIPLQNQLPKLATILQTIPAGNKTVIIEIIGERNFCSLKPDLLELMDDRDPSICLAVTRSITDCLNQDDIDVLFKHYLNTTIDTDLKATQVILAREIRRYGLQDSYSKRCIQLINEKDKERAVPLLELMAKIGGERALSQFKIKLRTNDETIRETLVQGLLNWPDSSALPLLIDLARNERSMRLKILAIQGSVRMVRESDLSHEDKLAWYEEALKLAARKEEKIQIVSAIADLRSPKAMLLLSGLLHDPDAGFEAGLAAMKMTTPQYRGDSPLTGKEVAEIWLQTQLDSSIYRQVLTQIDRQQRNSRRQLSEKTSGKKELYSGNLFNGDNLDGWQIITQKPDETNWGVENGILYTTGKGNSWLSTEQEYGNFILSLEFRLPPGGNSGVFLRAPQSGDPAYTGLEIQILDDNADQYKELKPWQYTGSIYAVQAPAMRVSKNAGDWQTMKITCNGPLIQVVLNGIMIIEGNCIDYMDKVDTHPGLKRRKGFIGLQDHTSRVEFRNIQLTELE